MNKFDHLLYFPHAKNCVWLYLVLITAFGRICIYVQFGIAAFGHYSFGQFFPIIINLLMYYSIVKYTYDFFQKRLDVNIEGMLMRFSASCIASLMSLRDESNSLFLLTALVLLLAPYMAGSLHKTKKVLILMSIIALLTLAISILTMLPPNDAGEHIAGRRMFYLEACNPFVQWLLFSILILARRSIESPQSGASERQSQVKTRSAETEGA